MFFKSVKVNSPEYRKFVAGLPCIINGVWDETVVGHHTRDKFKGMATKASDSSLLPLSHVNHMSLHLCGSDKKYFASYGIDNYSEIAQTLFGLWSNKEYEAAHNLILRKGK